MVPAELLEIYQPVIGFEAVSLWLNLYHSLINGFALSESSITQQMNITRSNLKKSLDTLSKYFLLTITDEEYTLNLPCISQLNKELSAHAFPYEVECRFFILIESFRFRRGQALGQDEIAASQNENPENHEKTPVDPVDLNKLTEQLADEFATRFIKECKFKPSRELRDRFEFWFEQLNDRRLLEELLARTKNKVDKEGVKGGCPSRYADKIVSQWLVQGIKTYEDLLRSDKEYQTRYEFYRTVEKELNKEYDTLTPSEIELIDTWLPKVSDPGELKASIRQAILSGEYRGKGSPGVIFIDSWLKGSVGKKKPGRVPKEKYSNLHKISDLERAVKRKTMLGMEDEGHEG